MHPPQSIAATQDVGVITATIGDNRRTVLIFGGIFVFIALTALMIFSPWLVLGVSLLGCAFFIVAWKGAQPITVRVTQDGLRWNQTTIGATRIVGAVADTVDLSTGTDTLAFRRITVTLQDPPDTLTTQVEGLPIEDLQWLAQHINSLAQTASDRAGEAASRTKLKAQRRAMKKSLAARKRGKRS